MTPRLRIPAERALVSARVSHILSPIEADLLQSGANYRKHVIDIAGSEYEGSDRQDGRGRAVVAPIQV
jgi:hypothetical protein